MAAICAAMVFAASPPIVRADYLAQIHEGLSSGSLSGTLELLGEPLQLVAQKTGSLSAGLDGALPVVEPLGAASFRLGEANSLNVLPFGQSLSPAVGGAAGEAGGATFGGRLTLGSPRDLPEIALPDTDLKFPASTLESASFDVAIRELSLQLASPSAIAVSQGAFDPAQTTGSLTGFADVNGQLMLSFDRIGEYLTAATMLGVIRNTYPEIVTSVDGNLGRRELTVKVQTRLDLAGETLANAATTPGGYDLVGLGPAINLPWLTNINEPVLEGVASVSLTIAGLAVAPAPGDASGDGAIDLSDFGVLKASFGQSTNFSGGDLDGSGNVDLSDFGVLKSQFGRSAAVAVPEPCGLALCAIGIAALVVGRRIRSRSSDRN